MKVHRFPAALALALMAASEPAQACMKFEKLNIDDIEYADVVVIGRISKYKIVLDPIARQDHQKLLTDPKMPAERRKVLEEQTRFFD
jgi:hypothetical protein